MVIWLSCFQGQNPCRPRAGCLARCFRLALLCLVCGLASSSSLHAQSLVLSDLVLDNSNSTMSVHYGLLVKDAPAIANALHEGLQLRFCSHVALYKKRSFGWDTLLVEKETVFDLHEDTLKQEGVMSIAGKEIRFPMTEFEHVFQKRLASLTASLGPWSMAQKGRTYVVRLTLSLSRVDVPVWIRFPLFFWSWDIVPATQFEMEFVY